MIFQVKNFIRVVGGLSLVLSLFYLTACISKSPDTVVNQEAITTFPIDQRTPFELAKDSKSAGYEDVMEMLRKKFPNDKELLTDYEQNELFPEMNIGQNFSCSAIESAFFQQEYGKIGIISSLKEGTDTLAITINGDKTISLLTGAAFRYGSTSPVKMLIKNNDQFGLLAEDPEGGGNIGSIILNKETGLGFWFKAETISWGSSLPGAQLHYLSCPTLKSKSSL